jgi:hypothetical protein
MLESCSFFGLTALGHENHFGSLPHGGEMKNAKIFNPF